MATCLRCESHAIVDGPKPRGPRCLDCGQPWDYRTEPQMIAAEKFSLDVACPKCGVDVGVMCRDPDLAQRTSHAERYEALP